jgi:hypothetical protein
MEQCYKDRSVAYLLVLSLLFPSLKGIPIHAGFIPDLKARAFAANATVGSVLKGVEAPNLFHLRQPDFQGTRATDTEVWFTGNNTPTQEAQVTSFTLVNADNNQDLQTLAWGTVINLATLPTQKLNIRANTNPSTVGSVLFTLDGAQTITRTENIVPYTLFGDQNGNYNAVTPATGSYTLTATPYSSSNAEGTAGTPLSLSFTVVNQTYANQVTSFTLVNADNEEDIQTLTEGAILNLATLPSNNLNIRANTSPSIVGSVEFNLRGAQSRSIIENIMPYVLFGNSGTDYFAWTPDVGSYSLMATPYSSSGSTGTAGIGLTVNFSVVSDNNNPQPPPPSSPTDSGTISGLLKRWQPLTIDFAGPASTQTSTSPNPFLDYRLQVLFTHQRSGKTYNVPGFFDGDGKGSGSGNVWRVRFNPDEEGLWTYQASFRKGSNVAIDLSTSAGTASSFDGASGSFIVAPFDTSASGFLKRGRLNYSGGFYWRFQDGSYWLKGGADSPENFLALSFAPHEQDWQDGDPDWNNGDGKGIIGALNYLHSVNVNSIYFLPMNIGGDGKDTWPFVGPIDPSGSSSNDDIHYDINKLTHWELVFEHAQEKGILLHFVLNETEASNKQELDNATLGTERKLFYRELVARFGHHNALQWNLCEEYNYNLPIDPSMIKSWAQYLLDVDPYDHPITVHNFGNPVYTWAPFVGDARFTVTAFQYAGSTAGNGSEVEDWRSRTAAAGYPIPVSLDEFRSTTTNNMAAQRKEILWPTYLSGGAGLEYYIGSADQSLQDFRTYESMWKWTWYARKFVQDNLPFWEMQPSDGLLSNEATTFGNGQVFAKAGEVYAVYLPDASRGGVLNLSGVAGTFALSWYNPRTGLFEGGTQTVWGGGNINLGFPPASYSEDWVVLLKANSSITQARAAYNSIMKQEIKPFTKLQITIQPNPTTQAFTLAIQSPSNEALTLKVLDLYGRVIETRAGFAANGILSLGNNYRPGAYYIEVQQGKQKLRLKAIKQPD